VIGFQQVILNELDGGVELEIDILFLGKAMSFIFSD
jgi:hypothetical protein